MSTTNIYAYKYGSRSPHRRILTVGIDAYNAFQTAPRHSTYWIRVHDETTLEDVDIRWADCGADCYCAAEWKAVTR